VSRAEEVVAVPPAAKQEPRCVIVVPCYNEVNRLKAAPFLKTLEDDAEIRFLFVNDGSRDGTLTMLREIERQNPERVGVLDKQPNGGKAEAVRGGLNAAMAQGDAEFVGFWDADLATPLDAIPGFLCRFEENPELEMVFGARIRLLGRHVHRRAVRHYLGRVFASVVSIALRLPIYDTQCGAKIFRVTPELKQILHDPFLSRWIFDVEILARSIALRGGDTRHLHDAIYEQPLARWEDVAGSKVGPGAFLTASADLARIYWRYLR
jgi:dolichyl-phosphate beta-glucosyltransferase